MKRELLAGAPVVLPRTGETSPPLGGARKLARREPVHRVCPQVPPAGCVQRREPVSEDPAAHGGPWALCDSAPRLTRAGRSDGLEGHRAVTVARALGRDSTEEGFFLLLF